MNLYWSKQTKGSQRLRLSLSLSSSAAICTLMRASELQLPASPSLCSHSFVLVLFLTFLSLSLSPLSPPSLALSVCVCVCVENRRPCEQQQPRWSGATAQENLNGTIPAFCCGGSGDGHVRRCPWEAARVPVRLRRAAVTYGEDSRFRCARKHGCPRSDVWLLQRLKCGMMGKMEGV